MADKFTRHLKMTLSASRPREEEGEGMGNRKVSPISFSPADQSNKHAGYISELVQRMSRLCVCWVYTRRLPAQIIHPEHLSTWVTTPENSCNWAHPTNWWQPARLPFLPPSLLLFFLWQSSFTHIYSLHLTHFPPPPQHLLSLIFSSAIYFNIYGWMI